MRPRFEERVLTAYQAFVYAAENNQPAPSNAVIADLCGYFSAGSTARLITTLIYRKMITAENIGMNRRVITITKTGLKTAKPAPPVPDKKQKRAPKTPQLSPNRCLPGVTVTTMTDPRWAV